MSIEKNFQFDKIRHLDLRTPVMVNQQDSLDAVLTAMRASRANCVLVCDSRKLTGIFTTRDVLTKIVGCHVDQNAPISEFMTHKPTALTAEASISDAIKMMDSTGVRHLPLINQFGEAVGLISSEDIVHYLVEHFPTEIYNLPPRLQQTMTTPEGA